MRLKFNRTLQIGYGVSILMLVVVGFISYRTVKQLLDSDHAVGHSNLIMQKLEKTISVMKDAETGQRGYLLTNRSQFLEPYNSAYQQAKALVAQAEVLTRDDVRQQANMLNIRRILLQRMTLLQKLIDKRQRGEQVTETDLDAEKSAMDALRAAVNTAENDEQQLLQKRITQLNRYSLLAPLFIVVAILLGILISLLSYIKVIRDIREKDRLGAALAEKERETAAFNEDLTAANEELTAANEELVIAREEVAVMNRSLEEKVAQRTRALQESEKETHALNEELTAINEELANANEELTSMNEEVAVTNDELASANEELAATNEELTETQASLQRSEKLFRSISLNIPKSLIIVIDKNHRYVTIEGDIMEKLGYDRRDYEGKHPLDVGPPERYEASRHLYERVIGGEKFSMERKAETGDSYMVHFVPLRNDENEVTAGLIIALDITEIKQGEERSAKLAAIVESSYDAIIGKTVENVITSWNDAAERIFGYTAEEMIGQTIYKIIPPDRHEEEPQLLGRLKNGDRVEHFETKRLTKNGKLLDVSLTISPVKDKQGNIIGLSKIARDITEKKEEEQRKSDFIGMVSHELKTPLTSLNAIIQVANARLKNSEDVFLSGAMQKANLQIKRMTGMINSFLDVSRLEAGKMTIEKETFNLETLMNGILEETNLIVTSHKIVMNGSGPVKIMADRDKLHSVISNLIGNAVKYSPRGTQIDVAYEVSKKSVSVSVKDKGHGIAPKDLEKIFDRYYRVEDNYTNHISGFGIGLYLSAEIIKRHNGKIWAESEIGKGATFFFSVPLA